jgi:hypothetical protein
LFAAGEHRVVEDATPMGEDDTMYVQVVDNASTSASIGRAAIVVTWTRGYGVVMSAKLDTVVTPGWAATALGIGFSDLPTLDRPW